MNRLSRTTVCRCLKPSAAWGSFCASRPVCRTAGLRGGGRAEGPRPDRPRAVAREAPGAGYRRSVCAPTSSCSASSRGRARRKPPVRGVVGDVVRPDPLPRVQRVDGPVRWPALAQAQRCGQAVPFPRGRPDAQPRVPPGAARRRTDHQAGAKGYPGVEGVLHRGVPRRPSSRTQPAESRSARWGSTRTPTSPCASTPTAGFLSATYQTDLPRFEYEGRVTLSNKVFCPRCCAASKGRTSSSRRQSRNWSRRNPRTRPVSPLLRCDKGDPPARSRHNWSRRRSSTRTF